MNLNLTEQEITYLMNLLGERPFKESFQLVNKINSQVQEQQKVKETVKGELSKKK